MQSKLERNGLYLAFDANCATCSQLSSRIKSAARNKIEVLPLDDPDVIRARKQAFAGDPPFKPTLLRVRGEEVQCWTGPTIGTILTKEIGFRDTINILQALGIERKSSHRTMLRPSVETKFNRRAFGYAAAGLAASLGIFATGSLTNTAKASNSTGNGDTRTVDDTEAQKMLDKALASEDLRNIAPEGTVKKLQRGRVVRHPELPEPGRFIELDQTGVTDLGAGQKVKGTGAFAAFSSSVFPDGTSRKTTSIALDNTLVLTFVEEHVDKQSAYMSQLYSIDSTNETVTTEAVAAGGVVSEPVPDGSTTQASDPCGGCAKTNLILSSSCRTDKVGRCVLDVVGCSLCAMSCGTLNPACFACLTASCGAAVLDCCERAGGSMCVPCVIKPYESVRSTV